MQFTVEDALSIYPLSEGKLIAGKTGLNRIVKSVNIMDAPDISDWIHEGEILFTTAYLLKDNPEDAIHLLRKLVQKGSAGLGIKLGRFWTDIPESLVREADLLSFPLIELPYQFTFSDQIKGLFNAEMQKRTQQLKRILNKQKELIRFALNGKTGDFFMNLSSIIEFPMAVVGSHGHILFNNLSLPKEQILKGWPWKPIIQSIRTDIGKLTLIPLQTHGDPSNGVGFVVFHSQESQSLREEKGLLLQTAEIIAVHLEAMEKEHLEGSIQKEITALVRDYLKQKVSIHTLMNYTARMGIPFCNEPYQCLLATVQDADHLSKEKLLKRVYQEMLYHPLLKEMSNLHFFIGDEIFSIIPAKLPKGERKLSDTIARIFSELSLDYGGSLSFSLSQPKMRAEDLADAYRECVNAKDTAKQLNLNNLVVEYDNVELAYIFQSVPREKMERFCQKIISPLSEKSQESSHDMLKTLEIFIQTNGQIKETANQLYIHRNTAAYRLEKISEILQVDFKNFDHLLKLKLFFLFEQILQNVK
ncbi:PucR family transcriptional regulator [Thermicanus aegyptius]|uniref:PucR family transcriptional regulator n=1 Tax=Thermicanus aegyptius TaxID=94009 RepID=UPI0003FEA9C9|nr:PucR family transcriptional regulator [Thermicanus aegyptius]